GDQLWSHPALEDELHYVRQDSTSVDSSRPKDDASGIHLKQRHRRLLTEVDGGRCASPLCFGRSERAAEPCELAAVAKVAASTPGGSGTSIASANGILTRSLRAPPHSRLAIGAIPKAAPAPAVSQLAVSPRRHRSQAPQLTWKGTITRSPSRATST